MIAFGRSFLVKSKKANERFVWRKPSMNDFSSMNEIEIVLRMEALISLFSFPEKAQEMKAIAEQGLNMAKDKCKVQ